VKTRTHKPPDIAVGTGPLGGAFTPDGKTGFVVNNGSNSVSTIDLKTRTKDPTDIPVGPGPIQMAITPDGKTGFVDNFGGPIVSAETPTPESIGTVSTIDVKTRTKDPTDITVGPQPAGPAVNRKVARILGPAGVGQQFTERPRFWQRSRVHHRSCSTRTGVRLLLRQPTGRPPSHAARNASPAVRGTTVRAPPPDGPD
jgi:YVTN family beta-propeller protein